MYLVIKVRLLSGLIWMANEESKVLRPKQGVSGHNIISKRQLMAMSLRVFTLPNSPFRLPRYHRILDFQSVQCVLFLLR